MTVRRLAYLSASLLIAGMAFADSPPQFSGNGTPPSPPSFSELDKNGDGVLNQDEVQGPIANDFNQIDANGDGQVTQNELNTFMQNHQPPRRTPPDGNASNGNSSDGTPPDSE